MACKAEFLIKLSGIQLLLIKVLAACESFGGSLGGTAELLAQPLRIQENFETPPIPSQTYELQTDFVKRHLILLFFNCEYDIFM